MIAKFKKRVDFTGLVSYANDIKSDEKRGRLLSYQGVCVVSNETIADSFNTQLRRPDSKGKIHHIGKPVKHVSISFSPEDAHLFPDNEEGDRYMEQLVDEWLQGMGITNAQYIVARHFDKAHPHCHLVYSRIAIDGSVISAYNEQLRSADVCKKIKFRHGLTFGKSSGEDINRDRLRPIQRTLFGMRSAVLSAAESSTSWTEFQNALESQSIEACFSFNRSTGELRGITFAKDGYRFSGSKLSRQKLTYSKLAAKFGEISSLRVADLPAKSTQQASGIDSSSDSKEKVLKTPTKFKKENIETMVPTAHEPVISIIPLSAIIELLAGGPVVVSSGGGGTTNDLDWNDERRRRQEAQDNQYIHKPFKRKR